MPYDFNASAPLNETRQYFIAHVTGIESARSLQRVLYALRMAEEAHAGQLRADGGAYIVHPIRTALLVAEEACVDDADMWIAALLHDAVEDSPLDAEHIRRSFGSNVQRLVLALTRARPAQETPQQRRDGKLAKWRRTMRAELDVRLLKVCDNLDNVLSWKFIRPDQPAYSKIPRWIMEAEELYLPLASKSSEKLYTWMRREVDACYRRGHLRGTWLSG